MRFGLDEESGRMCRDSVNEAELLLRCAVGIGSCRSTKLACREECNEVIPNGDIPSVVTGG